MVIRSGKLIVTVVAAILTITGSMSYAAPGKSKGAGGWEPSSDHQEFVVISLKTDPVYDDPEPACVALQIGMNLLMGKVPDSEGMPASVTPADKVVLFTTIGGVELINPDHDLSADVCLTPAGMGSLGNLLQGFIGLGGEIVVCPLCAIVRDITEPAYGSMGSGVDIHNLFLYADKVIDF